MQSRILITSLFVFLFFGSAILPLCQESTIQPTLVDELRYDHVGDASSSTFTYGLTEESKQVGDSVQVYIPLEAGYSMTSGSQPFPCRVQVLAHLKRVQILPSYSTASV
jgi:hypothetical protein